NDEADALIRKQAVTQDQAEREELLGQAQEMMAEELSTVPLLQGRQFAFAGEEVEGVILDDSYLFRYGSLYKEDCLIFRLCTSNRKKSKAMTIAAPEVVAEEQETDKERGGGFLRYVLIRFLLIFPTIFILVTTVFFLMRSTGDPITAALGGRLSAADLE